MSRMDREVYGQIEKVYRRMTEELDYFPGAPSDGFGNVTRQTSMKAQVDSYASEWWGQEEEDFGRFAIGTANFDERPAMILAVEAAKACCSGIRRDMARQLLQMAIDELDSETPDEAKGRRGLQAWANSIGLRL